MRRFIGLATAAGLAVAMAGCGGDSGSDSNELKIVYQRFGTFIHLEAMLKDLKPVYEKQNPGVTVKLIPVIANDADYFSKVNLMRRSQSTAPDVVYEDTYVINSDVAAGYLRPLDEYVSTWPDWQHFPDSVKQGVKGRDGKTYGVPMGTDTRGLWYNKAVFKKAGLPVPWEPKSWNDVIGAARQIKAKAPGVTPFNMYSGKPAGEAASMQGYEMLLYGTDHQLYSTQSQKWVAPSKGMTDSFGFIKTMFSEGLTPKPQVALDKNLGEIVNTKLLPEDKLGISLDGSWVSSNWLKTGTKPWPEWEEKIGVTPMPTQNGQAPGKTSLSGGWTLAIGAKTKNPGAAWKFISLALNRENSQRYAITAGQLAVRDDVAKDSAYLNANPTNKFWTDLVSATHYRPAYAEYPEISNQIQKEMESVMTGQSSPDEATEGLTESIQKIAGAEKVEAGG
ncbi:extracellular solute-binding protein [Actinomadura sp. HBU206391]|uniref:extracellular solute-binding protein n=1 Tax=Actinomadura sp. HBU206391 TaxID=2731692 RepID=UPI00165083E9|nr:extracellular solute-binding protein [Actinomadura sp. HBU206391]MBC6463545.1 extracellular solute-binding protein [Actinomadura sp. HBU206391]